MNLVLSIKYYVCDRELLSGSQATSQVSTVSMSWHPPIRPNRNGDRRGTLGRALAIGLAPDSDKPNLRGNKGAHDQRVEKSGRASVSSFRNQQPYYLDRCYISTFEIVG